MSTRATQRNPGLTRSEQCCLTSAVCSNAAPPPRLLPPPATSHPKYLAAIFLTFVVSPRGRNEHHWIVPLLHPLPRCTGVDEFLQGTTRAQSLAEHLHILDNDELGLDDRHWEREALHLQRLCAKYMDVMCSTADGLTKAEQHLEPYLELSDPQADALQTALFHIKDVRGQLQQQHTELQVKAPYALQHSADAECQTDAQQCVPDVPSPDRPMFLCDPDCCFIVYETLPFADDAPDVSCAEEPPRSLLQEPTEGPSVRWGGVDGCTTPDETSAVEVTNRLPEEQVPNQQQELKHLRAEPKLRVSADAVLPCLAPTPPEPSARTADPQNDPSPRLVKSPTKGSPHGAVQTPCAAAGVLAEEVALRSETVAEGEPRARTDNELVSLENEVEQLRQEVNAQRSQAALQIIQLRQEYEKKLDTFAMAQRQVQQREEEIKVSLGFVVHSGCAPPPPPRMGYSRRRVARRPSTYHLAKDCLEADGVGIGEWQWAFRRQRMAVAQLLNVGSRHEYTSDFFFCGQKLHSGLQRCLALHARVVRMLCESFRDQGSCMSHVFDAGTGDGCGPKNGAHTGLGE